MRPMKFVREQLGITQAKLAEVAGVGQGTVSRWETETEKTEALEPSRVEMAAIREWAQAHGKTLEDSWFFAVPGEAA